MIDWEKYGFKLDEGSYTRPDLELCFIEEDGFINIYAGEGTEYLISEGKIPATNQSVVLLLKAFNCPKLV